MRSYPLPINLLPRDMDAQLQKRSLKNPSQPDLSQIKSKDKESTGNRDTVREENTSAEDEA
jgi:hypothetical protein